MSNRNNRKDRDNPFDRFGFHGGEKYIHLDSSSVIVITENYHPILGPVLVLTQFIKVDGEFVIHGKISLPSTLGSSAALNLAADIINSDDNRSKYSGAGFAGWMGKLTSDSDQENPPPRDDRKSRRSPAKKEIVTKSVPITKKERGFRNIPSGKPVSPERCNERIKGVKGLMLKDVIHNLSNGLSFQPPIEIPFDQLKVIVAYGFKRFERGIVATEVARILLDSGVLFTPKSDNTIRKVLHQLAAEKKVNFITRTSGKGRQYNLWMITDRSGETSVATAH